MMPYNQGLGVAGTLKRFMRQYLRCKSTRVCSERNDKGALNMTGGHEREFSVVL